MSYFDKFSQPNEQAIRVAVGDVYANYRIADEMHDSPDKRVETNGTVYAHGSREVKPGTVRSPGTRRVGKGPQRKQRWAES